MQPQLIILETREEISTLREYIKPFEYVFFDTETTGVDISSEVMGFSVCCEEDKAYYVILHKYSPVTKSIDYASKEVMDEATALIQDLMSHSLIEHNGMFDSAIVERYFKVPLIKALHTCTMLLAHLLNENRKVGLKELAKELLGESATKEQDEMKASVIKNGGRWTKDDKDMYMADSYLLGKYGAKDPWLTRKIFYKLIPELFEQGLDKFFYEDESMPLLRGPTYELNTTGMRVDQVKLQLLKKTLEAESEECKARIQREISSRIAERFPGTKKSNTFNIGSGQQLAWLLFGQYHLEFSTLTDGGRDICYAMGLKLPYTQSAKRQFIADCLRREGEKITPDAIVNGKLKKGKKIKAPWAYISTDSDSLEKLTDKQPWIQNIIDLQKKQKLLSTYIGGVEDNIKYGVVTSSYLQHGTLTGRYASRNPNLMNLPRDDQRIKDCYIPRPGCVFVSADYSQLEPRVFSYYSQDEKLMAAFTGKTDFYSVVGCDVFDILDCEPTKDGFGSKYKELRQDSKTFALASAYGATPGQLAPAMGKPISETQEIMERYFERFKGVRKMMVDAHDLAKSQGYVENLFGRRRRLPDAMKINALYGTLPHWKLPYEARRVLNMACNFRIQSTSASLINRAAIRFYNDSRDLGIKAKIVSQIHDQLVIECPEEHAVSACLLLQTALETTNILPGMPLEADPWVAKSLAK